MGEAEYNEAEAAREIAKILGTEHTELYITEEDAKAVIPRLAFMFGEPFADSSQIPTYLVSKMTREHVTVSLSGDGGDELFCGYTSYASVSRIWNKMKNVPYFLRKPCSGLVLHSPLARKEIFRIKGKLLGAKDPADIYLQSRLTDPLTMEIAKQRGNLPYKYTTMPEGYLKEVNHTIMLMDMLNIFLTSRMARVKNRHIVFLCHRINCIHKRKKILFDIYIFFPMCRQKNIFFRL